MKRRKNSTVPPLQLSLHRRAMRFAKPYRRFLIIILLLTLVSAAANAVEPLIMKLIFDNLTQPDSVSYLIKGVAGFIVLLLIREVAVTLANYFTWKTRIKIQISLQEAMVEKIHKLPHEFLRNEGVGAVMSNLDRSINGFISAINELSFNMIPSLLYLIISVIVMLQLNWQLALVVIAFAPLPGIISHYASPRQTKRERILYKKWARIYARFNEVLSGIITVRSFAMEDYEKHRFMRYIKNANNIVLRGLKYDNTYSFFQNITIITARAAALGAGAYLVIKGNITLGTLVAFLAYIGGLFGPVQGLTGIYRTLRLASVSLERVFSILDTQDFLGDAPDAVEAENFDGDVSFKDVHFTYQVTGSSILRGIDLEVKKGEMIAVVGPSGAGKTTLMALLMRFYDPIKGSIEIDGVDIKKLKQNSLRKQIGVVLQDALLFNESVKDNIAYGRPTAAFEEVVEAAKAANAHEFIMKLRNNYNTSVGERGALLSQGERQRISIARAILKDPSILIFDEATSSLDAELEALVQEALERLIKERTTFVIAHRLATIVNADRIIVLKNGKIIETGTHSELITQNGYYTSLVDKQTKGLIYHSLAG
jgi:ATP-binding cassette, subfamily B, bacterial